MKLIIFKNADGHIMQTVEAEAPEVWLAAVLPRIPGDWTHEIIETEASN